MFCRNPKISIAIICYNCSNYIEKCIYSVLCQNIDKEIIVIDDCSTDDSYEKLKQLSKTYPLLKIFQNKTNKGTVYTRTKALKHCHGEFALMVDGDDELIYGSLSVLYKEAKEIDVLEFSMETDAKTSAFNINFKNEITLNNIKEQHDKICLSNTLCNKLISKRVYKKILKNINLDVKHSNYSDVIFFMCNLINIAKVWKQTPTKGYYYFTTRGMTTSYDDLQRFEQYCNFAYTLDELERLYGENEYLNQKWNIVCNQAIKVFINLQTDLQEIVKHKLYILRLEDNDINMLIEYHSAPQVIKTNN